MKQFFVIALVLCAFSAVSAQSAVDPALSSVITQAFDQTRASASLHIETQQLVAVQNADFTMQTQSSASWSLAAAASGWNLSGSQTTLMQFGDTPTESTTEYIVIDGVTYMNLDAAQMGGFAPGGGQDQSAQPQGWFEVTAADDASAQPLMRGAANTENLAAQAFGGLMFPVTAESITAVSELPADTIDGQAMRVLQMSMSAQAVIDSDASVLLRTSGMGGAGAPPTGDQGQPPGDGQGQPPTDAQGQPPTDAQGQPPTGDQPLDPANVQITFAVYIGQDDGLVHRIYSVIEIAANREDGSQAVTTTTSIYDYSAFNQPVEIAAPSL